MKPLSTLILPRHLQKVSVMYPASVHAVGPLDKTDGKSRGVPSRSCDFKAPGVQSDPWPGSPRPKGVARTFALEDFRAGDHGGIPKGASVSRPSLLPRPSVLEVKTRAQIFKTEQGRGRPSRVPSVLRCGLGAAILLYV